jgi:nicotinamidase/pyrazinamidase
LNDLHLNFVYSNKGTNPNVEEYGAFSFIQETSDGFALQNVNDSYETIIPTNATNVKVCGIAGDYCVLETTKNLVNSGYFNVTLILDAIASIDDGTKITEYSKFETYLAECKPNQKVEVEIYRNGRTYSTSIVIGSNNLVE